jgi:hypothetical protein
MGSPRAFALRASAEVGVERPPLQPGDITYYAALGNLAIFYRNGNHTNGLVKLGCIESGIAELARMSCDFSITIELVE